jgi:hypothetical protein
MNSSGDAAEQVVRISLEGVEYLLRLTGSGVQHVAALLAAVLKSPDKGGAKSLKTSGKERLKTMLKSGQPLKIFAVQNKDLTQFAKEARRYGVVYCALREKDAKPSDLVDLMVRMEDAPKLDRILERLEFMSVEATVQPSEREAPDIADSTDLMDLLIDEEGKPQADLPEAQKAKDAAQQDVSEQTAQNPLLATTERGTPSEPSSSGDLPSAKGNSEPKPSVKAFLRERTARNKKQETKAAEAERPAKKKAQKRSQTSPQPHARRKKSKKTKTKER